MYSCLLGNFNPFDKILLEMDFFPSMDDLFISKMTTSARYMHTKTNRKHLLPLHSLQLPSNSQLHWAKSWKKRSLPPKGDKTHGEAEAQQTFPPKARHPKKTWSTSAWLIEDGCFIPTLFIGKSLTIYHSFKVLELCKCSNFGCGLNETGQNRSFSSKRGPLTTSPPGSNCAIKCPRCIGSCHAP